MIDACAYKPVILFLISIFNKQRNHLIQSYRCCLNIPFPSCPLLMLMQMSDQPTEREMRMENMSLMAIHCFNLSVHVLFSRWLLFSVCVALIAMIIQNGALLWLAASHTNSEKQFIQPHREMLFPSTAPLLQDRQVASIISVTDQHCMRLLLAGQMAMSISIN